MNDYELAGALFGRGGDGTDGRVPRVYSVEALEDSRDGRVVVALDSLGGEGFASVPCVPSVKRGQSVRLSVVGGSASVTGVDGWGDEVAEGIAGAVSSVDVEYSQNASATEPPADGWQTDAPPHRKGFYIWQRTKTTTGAGTETSPPVCLQGLDGEDGRPGRDGRDGKNGANGYDGRDGKDGANGRGVASVVEEYYLSTSETSPRGGYWSQTPAPWREGCWYFTRSRVRFTDGTTQDTDPVLARAVNGANDAAARASWYCWSDEKGTHITTERRGTRGASALLDGRGLSFYVDGRQTARYEGERVSIGEGSKAARVDMCGGAAVVGYDEASRRVVVGPSSPGGVTLTTQTGTASSGASDTALGIARGRWGAEGREADALLLLAPFVSLYGQDAAQALPTSALAVALASMVAPVDVLHSARWPDISVGATWSSGTLCIEIHRGEQGHNAMTDKTADSLVGKVKQGWEPPRDVFVNLGMKGNGAILYGICRKSGDIVIRHIRGEVREFWPAFHGTIVYNVGAK